MENLGYDVYLSVEVKWPLIFLLKPYACPLPAIPRTASLENVFQLNNV